MATAVDYLKGRGVAIARGPIDLGDSYRGELRDPDGLIIELRYLMAHSDDQVVYQGSLKDLWEKAAEKKKANVIKIDKAK
ncbi:MAG: VOC family protein [Thermodesulfobacteriota bacterium]